MAVFQRGSDWVSRLPAKVQTAVRERMQFRTLKDGERLYERGATATGLYEVHSGYMHLKGSGASGDEVLITVYGPGTCLGEVPLLGDGARAFDAVAHGEVRIAVLGKTDFDELSALHPEIYQTLVTKLCRVIIGLLSHIEDAALLSLRQRLVRLIVSAAEAYGSAQSDGVEIAMPLSQADMGKMLGMTRQSIQRELNYLRAEGLLNKRRGRWVVFNLDAMQVMLNN
jgi:CRP/FNR family cyclic AMP-dependent transcriptional regulator